MITTSEQQIPLAKRVRAHIELADPITWISPAMICICGALASGTANGFHWWDGTHWGLILLGALMTGPLGTGFSQSINDYYDREIDAINDPSRPIPAGLVSLNGARANWLFLGLATFLVSLIFKDAMITVLAVFGIILSVLYSMPPIKFKKNYLLGPPAVGIGYVTVSWMVGHIIFAPITWESITVAMINGGLTAGMLVLNDIKSVEGDRQHGLQSLAVAIGVQPALLVAYTIINLCEILFLVLAVIWGNYWVAAFIAFAVIAPIYSQIKLYGDPSHKNFMRYLIATNPFVALIQIVSAFLVGGYFG
ncbi:(bacterio)chlorophyll synthase [Candidatus Oscillochloris fontis]|uniref:(bacterio)chlorophyll synthase n=1 Tax=Candidatus Oscillochloris fontis TaxID=2496868 RepID=UPI001583C5C3|nr:(bacterio)chlorophyll synthase [Candidatus Oscillochloris fontis]